MKRHIRLSFSVILVIILVVCLCACGSPSSHSNTSEGGIIGTNNVEPSKEPVNNSTPAIEEPVNNGSKNEPAPDTNEKHEKYKLYLDVMFEANLFFSKYDIEIWIDDLEIGNVKNGTTFTQLLEVDEGSHAVSFFKSGDHSIKSSKNIDLKSDSTFSCKLASKSDAIDLSDYKFTNSIVGTDLEMINVVGINLDKALSKLKEIGFSNINTKSKDGSMIILTSNWVVIEQNIAEGEINDKNVEIILTCQKEEKESGTKSPANDSGNIQPPSVGAANALRSAKSYLRFTAFSYKGLIDQLLYEGYKQEEAEFAADNCGADWNEQAVKSAKDYLDVSAFSRKSLIDQLEYEQFTTEQATYGVDNCGADWNEQAAKSAKSYLELTSFSRKGLIDQLLYEGFTREQAEYGVSQNGY